MDAPGQDPRDDSIGDLFGRLIEDGRSYAKSELELLKKIAQHRAGRARNGAIMLGAGVAILLAAVIALVLGLVLGLAVLIGPLLAGLAITLVLAGIGYLLVRQGMVGLRALAGDEEERQAIARGEQAP